jgi:hypothetical protein
VSKLSCHYCLPSDASATNVGFVESCRGNDQMDNEATPVQSFSIFSDCSLSGRYAQWDSIRCDARRPVFSIDRSFENNSDMVSTPPRQLAHAYRLKTVEGDEKIYRKKPESI